MAKKNPHKAWPGEIRVCECGCGKTFRARRPWQRFVDNKHRSDYHRARRSEAIQTADALKDRIARIEKLVGITPMVTKEAEQR